ncbi:MAG: glycosyltransferase 87 family protein [Bacteroidota bacterium]
MSTTRLTLVGLASLLFCGGVLFLGFAVDRTNFWDLMLGFIGAFAGYFGLLQWGKAVQLSRLVGLGILIRLILVFAFPLLSDDLYRFLWDGYLLNAGITPFAELPAYYVENVVGVPGLSPALFQQLNSPEYYTIYPPLAQLSFYLATLIAGDNWWLGSVLMKLILFATEIGTLWLLWRMLPKWKLPRWQLLLYWLNPLIIIEIVGNLHFEGMMVFFLLLALYFLQRQRIITAALAFAASVAAKLLPLMLLPFLIVRLWRRESSRPFWVFSFTFGITVLLLFVPLISLDVIENFGSSLDLYFRKFEFNASIYYLFRAYGYYEIGWNQIARFGPLLGKMAAIFILIIAAIEGSWNRKRYVRLSDIYLSLPKWWMFAFTVYLLFATTVHPWYLSVPILMSVFGRWRYPIVWSFFIVLTYASYTSVPYRENYYLVGLEYVAVVAYLLWESRYGASKTLLPTA